MQKEDFQDRMQQAQPATSGYARLGHAPLGYAQQIDPQLTAAIRQVYERAASGSLSVGPEESAVTVEVVGSEQAVASLLAALSVLEQKLAPIPAPLPPQATGGGRGEAPRAPRSPLAEQLQSTRQKIHTAEAKVQELIDRIEV